MIGWVIFRTKPQKERELLRDFVNLPANFYVPEQFHSRSISRHNPERELVGGLIAPCLLFGQVGYRHIDFVLGNPNIGGLIRGSDDEPYAIRHDAMTEFMMAVDAGNKAVRDAHYRAQEMIATSKKLGYKKVGDEISAKLHALLKGLPNRCDVC